MCNDVVSITKKLVSIPSVTPKDLGCQDFLIQRLSSCGFKIEILNFNNTKNFLASKGEGRSLLFLGHTDVVDPGCLEEWETNPFSPKIRNNYLYGRGTSDMKGAIAAMLGATEGFILKNPKHVGRLLWLITSDEEGEGTDGIRKVSNILKERNEKVDFCLVGEPTSEKKLGDCIKNGRRGSLNAELKIYGTQGHIAYPFLADNPIHKSLKFLKELSRYVWDLGNNFFLPTQIQIYKVFTQNPCRNMIPKILEVEFNFRFSPLRTIKELKNIVYFLLKKNNLKYSIHWQLYADSFFSRSIQLKTLLSQCINQITNFRPVIKTSGGTSDGRFLIDISDEIIEFGLKNNTIHKVNECVNILDLKNLEKIYTSLLEKIFL
ncbi:succinyl-diaminopimelate desuccinylase [Buchnera aphidicola]|uniref:succinyl-diaminopimelate desuccinylase n=1 Tax=Buchnera aphidicola TaxID=9 RepID=UPI0031B6C88F